MSPLEILQLQLRLEGREVLNGNLLRHVEAVPDEDMPLMIIAQLDDERVIAYFDESLQPELLAELTGRISNITFPNIGPLTALLERRNVSFETGH